MKILLIILLTILLSGCITSSYKNDSESFKVTSLFKSVDGLKAERSSDGVFLIKVDKTSSQTEQMNMLFEMMLKTYMATPQ